VFAVQNSIERREPNITMSLSTIPKQIEARLPNSAKDVPWTRTVAIGALITGVVLLLSGKRKAGVAVAAAGTLFGVVEEPESLKHWWEGMPRYVASAQEFLGKVEGFVEQLAEQGNTVRRIMRK
jgi:hypothetical protein